MKYRYFVGNEEITKQLLDTHEEAHKQIMSRYHELFDYLGDTEGFLSRGGRAISPILKNSIDIKGIECVKINDGYSLLLNKRYKTGKDLFSKMKEFNKFIDKRIDFSDMATSHLKISSMVVDGYAAYRTSAGFSKEKLFVMIPIDETGREPFPTIPDSLTEIKKSEFIALTEE